MQLPHISVCVCTFKRPVYLHLLLTKLGLQQTAGLFTYSVVVVDNDSMESARDVATSFPSIGGRPVHYSIEPEQSIACARNRAVANASGDFIAFIDDDEYPADDWLCRLFQAHAAYGVDGVLGPVKPYFEHDPPAWVIKGRFFERPMYPTGFVLGYPQTRTGNVLFARGILEPDVLPFRIELGSGGSDVDFFCRMMAQGRRFIWCNEAIVHEVVPPSRCRRSFLLKRALLRGSNFQNMQADRMINIVKSLIATPCYAVALPFLALAGQHLFLRYLIKLLDHASRLLGFVGVHLVTRREM